MGTSHDRARRTRFGLVALLGIALLASGCGGVGSTADDETSVTAAGKSPGVDLEFTISLPKDRFGKGAKIPLRMTLRNMENRPVIVNKRFQVNDRAAPPEFREVYLTIKMPNGKRAEFAWDIRVGFPEPKDFRNLKPGGQVSGKADVQDLFSLTKKGNYIVKATYKNAHRGPTVFDVTIQGFVLDDIGAAEVKTLSNALQFEIR